MNDHKQKVTSVAGSDDGNALAGANIDGGEEFLQLLMWGAARPAWYSGSAASLAHGQRWFDSSRSHAR